MSAIRFTALVPALALGAALLTACGPGTPEPGGSTPPAMESATPSAEPTIIDPTPTPEEADAELRANVVDAVSSGNTAAIEGYLAPTVHVTYCASEAEGDVTDPALVISNISGITSPSATWDFDLPASKLDTYANDPGHYPSYADDFPPGAIVGLSSQKKVISFVVAGGQITRVFLCTDEYALTFVD